MTVLQKITIQEDGCKILKVQSDLGKLANSPNAPWKMSRKIFLLPGITYVCKVMTNRGIVFNSDRLENFTQTNSGPGNLEFTDLTHGILFFQGKPGIYIHPPISNSPNCLGEQTGRNQNSFCFRDANSVSSSNKGTFDVTSGRSSE